MKPIIACVLKKSNVYDIDYVKRLINGVKKNIKTDVEYVCLSDEPKVSNFCKFLPLKNRWPTWWNKLELFSNPYLINKPVVYFDLDTVINKDITPLILYQHKFTMLKGFIKKLPASGIMAWNGDYSHITKQFNKVKHIHEYKTMEKWGDQGFIRDKLGFHPDYFQDLFPDMICSYKRTNHIARKKYNIICFHGRPRPRDVKWII